MQIAARRFAFVIRTILSRRIPQAALLLGAFLVSTQVAPLTSVGASATGVVTTLPANLCDGSSDRTATIQSAIDSAGTGAGNGVALPSGICVVSAKLRMDGAYPVTLSGAGMTGTTIREVGNDTLLSAPTNGSTVERLTLDDSTTTCGCHAFGTSADNTLLQNVKLISGTGLTRAGTGAWTAYYAGDFSASGRGHAIGNVMTNVTAVDNGCSDGISFSYQDNAQINSLTEIGSRLALYRDVNTTVNGDTYTPAGCTHAQDGIWLTPPSIGISIRNFVSGGSGGRYCPNSVGTCSAVTISGEQAARGLQLGNISGVSLLNSTFHGWLYVDVTLPGFTTTGTVTGTSASMTVCEGLVSITGIVCRS